MSKRYDKKHTFMLCMLLGSIFGFSQPIAFRLGFIYVMNGVSLIFFIGLGAFAAGIGLDVIKFPQGANPADVPIDALNGLAMFAGPISMVILLSSLWVIRPYPLNQTEHARITQAIHDMKTECAG